jgi:hypothetical protein
MFCRSLFILLYFLFWPLCYPKLLAIVPSSPYNPDPSSPYNPNPSSPYNPNPNPSSSYNPNPSSYTYSDYTFGIFKLFYI